MPLAPARKPVDDRPRVVHQDLTVDRAARSEMKQQRARVIWLTGLPGAGKTTIANAAEVRLHELGVHTYVLDGDNVREALSRDLGFSSADRAENVRRVAEVSRLMMDAGLVVIVALVSPFTADRRLARSLFAPGDFVEVYVDTPSDVCAERDPKQLYARAARGEIADLTGRGQAYEPPVAAEIIVHGTGPLAESVEAVVAAALSATGGHA